MARIQPLKAVCYDLERVGGLPAVAAPPYDVIDAGQRAGLLARSQFNVVEIDLPVAPDGGDQYAHAASVFDKWQQEGILERDLEDGYWALEQDYTGPDGVRRTRRGFFARVPIQDYGPGRVRPHERTHPGPKEDRLRLTRATQANLSPIFSLYDDPASEVWDALGAHVSPDRVYGETTDEDGTAHRLYRITDREAVAAATEAFGDRELLIADGHHRYETARVYQQENPAASHVLMCLVALQDPGLTVFPTHRLLNGIADDRREALRAAIERDWEVTPLGSPEELEPTPAADGRITLGYYDAFHKRPLRLQLRDPALADAALPGRAEPYRRLDTAVLEALVLTGPLGMTEDDISHFNGIDYARSNEEAVRLIESGERQAAFFMGATPVAHVRDVAAAGETMPPKSTYFFPKVLTGLVFNPLD